MTNRNDLKAVNPSYDERVANQVEQYADNAKLKGLPPIYKYWNQTYVVPKLKHVFGTSSIWEIYADAFLEAMKSSKSTELQILSIGCGNARVELNIAYALKKHGVESFRFVCTELSNIQVRRAQNLVKENGFEEHFAFEVVDVNSWTPCGQFDGVMAQHTLHHIWELEATFASITECMKPDGAFIVVDIVGRNGHMRWPETLEFVNLIWKIIPEEYKFNHQFGKYIDPFLNWDCSKKGFEGIRAQDIMSLLIKNFSFSYFVGVGGIIDVFVERGYGHNFLVDDPKSIAYIDLIEELNEALISCGRIKPTMIFAICQHLGKPSNTRCYDGLTPERAVRWPGNNGEI